MQKGDRVAGVSMHSIECPASNVARILFYPALYMYRLCRLAVIQ